MVDLLLQKRADLWMGLRQVGILVDDHHQALVVRKPCQRLKDLVETAITGACGIWNLRQHSGAEHVEVGLGIGPARLEVNRPLTLDKLRDQARFAHAPASVDNRHLEFVGAVKPIELRKLTSPADKHKSRPWMS